MLGEHRQVEEGPRIPVFAELESLFAESVSFRGGTSHVAPREPFWQFSPQVLTPAPMRNEGSGLKGGKDKTFVLSAESWQTQ